MPDTTIGEEIAAEIQLSIEDDADELSSRRERISDLLSALQELDARQKIAATDSPISVGVITSDRSSRPAFSGLLYGTAAIHVRMDIENHMIENVSSDARTNIETCDFGDGHRRIKWNERQLIAELATDALNTNDLDLLIIDAALTIPRQEALTYDESPAKSHWDQMLDDLDGFWQDVHDQIRPWDDDGPFIIGVSRTRSNLLFTALRDGDPAEFVSNPPKKLCELVQTKWDTLTDVGPNRVLDELLTENTRTLTYPFGESRLDRRWLPNQLRELGVQGMFFRHQADNDILHFELPGAQYSIADIDAVSKSIRSLCWLSDVPVPVPLWYARRESTFPDEMLDLYYKKLADQRQ